MRGVSRDGVVCSERTSLLARGRKEAVVARAADDRCARTTYRDDSYVRREGESASDTAEKRGRERRARRERARVASQTEIGGGREQPSTNDGIIVRVSGCDGRGHSPILVRGPYRRHRARGGVVRETGPRRAGAQAAFPR